jgi:hypothetical protein
MFYNATLHALDAKYYENEAAFTVTDYLAYLYLLDLMCKRNAGDRPEYRDTPVIDVFYQLLMRREHSLQVAAGLVKEELRVAIAVRRNVLRSVSSSSLTKSGHEM